MQQNTKPEADPAEAFLTKVTEVIAPLVQDLETRLEKVKDAQDKLKEQLHETHSEVAGCRDLLQSKVVKSQPPNTALFEIMADRWYQKIAAKLEALPKKHSFRILFFPENNTAGYLKKLWGFILKWLFWIMVVKSLYSLGDKYLEGHNEEYRYKNAWETLYKNSDKKSKRIMDDMLEKN